MLLESVFGVLADTGIRRPLVVGGGIAFALALGVFAAANSVAILMLAGIILYPASGAFVSLSQATLMDMNPDRREWNMARWTLSGSVGAVLGPLLLAGAAAAGLGWRVVVAAVAVATLPVVALVRWIPWPLPRAEHAGAALRRALQSLRNQEVIRWLLLLQMADLMLDVLAGWLALYFVDVVMTTPSVAAVAVAIWIGAGLVGDALLLVVLKGASGVTYLRVSAIAVSVAYPLFLLVPGAAPKIVLLGLLGTLNAGWYAIPQAALYDSVPGGSGIVLSIENVAGGIGLLWPLAIGFVAGVAGLQTALWIPFAAPVLMLVLLPHPRGTPGADGV